MTARAIPQSVAAPAALLYGSALLQGLTLVSFPAAAAILKQAGLSDAAYGAIFLPQVGAAIAGAFAGSRLSRRLGLFLVLALALAANAGSQIVLASISLASAELLTPYAMTGTALLGLGFGLAGAPFNSLPAKLFPSHRDSALVVVHSILGLGLAVGPLLLQALAATGLWNADPLALLGCAASLCLVALQLAARHPAMEDEAASEERPPLGAALLLPCLIAVVYALAEGTLSNWVIVYVVQDRGFDAATGSTALSAFWFALVAGRLLVSMLVARLSPMVIWRTLPFAILTAMLLLPGVESRAGAVAAFGFAGFACSAFFPLSVAAVANRFPNAVPFVSSLLTAALMTGVGLGSFAIGGLSSMFGLSQLYLLSSAYPLAIVLLMAVDARLARRRAS